MDDTQGSRMPDAVATRKRRSSILKNQRPPRTPFSELEFNVVTPTDTAKSRRVSFSRRTDVAEFVTNEGTTTWKTMYVEQNRSLESSGNESAMHPSRPTVCSLGKRAMFEQQFQEEAVDLGMHTPNLRVHEMNMSLMNINFSQQIADLEREDMKFSAPQKMELSSFTEDRSKLFGELTATVAGVSSKIQVDFSAIQPVGDKCDDLDEIQRDLLGSNSNQAMRRPFDSPDASEYIEVDLNTTHIGMKRDASDMSITDSIRSPVQGIPQGNVSLNRDRSTSKQDWTADKENIAVNPYIAPKESANFAINEMPDQVLVFDGKKLSVQMEKRQASDGNGGEVEYRQPIPSNAQKKTIVLNVNDDLPNFVDDASLFGQGHGLSTSKVDHVATNHVQINPASIPTGLGLNSQKTVIYNDLADVSVSRAIPTNIVEQEKRRTIVFENDGGELSMTQALPSNFSPRSDVTQNRTVVYSGGEISFTQALPVKVLSQPRDVAPQNRTIVYGSEDISFTQAVPVKVLSNEMSKAKPDFDLSFTQALPNNVLLSHKPSQPNKRNTTVYGNDAGDISITRVLPSNIIVGENMKTKESVVSGNSLQHKSILYDQGYDISMTEAVPKNIILGNELKSNHTSVDSNISETKMIPSNIVQYDGLFLERNEKEHKDDGSLKGSDRIATNMSITEAIPGNVVLSHLISKRKTIDAANMSVTKVLPTNIIETEKRPMDGFNDFSTITHAVTDNLVILNDVQKWNTAEKIDSRHKTLDLPEEKLIATDNASNATSDMKVHVTGLIGRELLSKSFAKTDLSASNMDMSAMQADHANKVENVQEKSELHENKCSSFNEDINKVLDVQLNDLQKDEKIGEASKAFISEDKTEFAQKDCDASPNAKSIYSKSMSLVEEYGNIMHKDELSKQSHANILETSKHGAGNTKFDTVNTRNDELLETSCKQSEEISHTSKNERNNSGLFQNSEKNPQKSLTEMSFRDVLVYQAVTNHNVSKQMKKIDNVHAHIPQTDISTTDIVPKSITLANAIQSDEMKIDDNGENISKNKTFFADIVALDGILEMSTKEKREVGDRFDNFPSDMSMSEAMKENFLILPKRKTLDLTDVEVKHTDVVTESPARNDMTLPKEHEEECSRIGTIHDVSTTQQKLRKSNLIEETLENMHMTYLNKRKTIDATNANDIVMGSPQRNYDNLEKEHKEEYSRIHDASITQPRKSTLNADKSENMLVSNSNKKKSIDHTDGVENRDIVMESPQQSNITLEKMHEVQYSRISTTHKAPAAQRKPKKSILSELLRMSDESIDISADCIDNECEASEKVMQAVPMHAERNETHKSYEAIQNDKSYKLTDISHGKMDIFEQENAEEHHSPKMGPHYSNATSVNLESTQLNDEQKQSRENTMSDLEKNTHEMAVEKYHYKEADDTKELLGMLSDFTDKTMIKSNEQPTKTVVEQVASTDNSYSNEPRHLSLAKSRMSTVLSREDLLMNISMAYAALQQARTDTGDSDNEDTLDDSAEDQIEPVEPEEIGAVDEIDQVIEELDYRRRSVRASTEVVKTLQFDDTTTDVIQKSNDNLSPLRKSVYGDISQRVDDSRARVIPSYEVSDEVKLLMQDLVKPLADDTVFGKTSPEKSTNATNSTRSINLQANIITSSQIDIDMDSASGIASVDVQTDPENMQNDIIQLPEAVKEPILRKSDTVRQTPPVLFDPANPLNNVVLPKGNTEIHKYSPNKSASSIAEEIPQASPMKSILEKNTEEYDVRRVSTHYKINTSAVVVDSREKDFRDQHSSISIDGNLDTHIKDSEVNTLIAMKCNKELLEETSCLTLVDDGDLEPIEIEDSQLDLLQPEKKATAPLRVIFKTDVCDENYTSSVDLDSDDGKPKKRIYSPAKRDPSKKVAMSSPDVTPKPLSKIQKLSNTPNNASMRKSIKHEAESFDRSKTSDAKAVSSKGKYGGTVIVQQMAECKIDSSVDVAQDSEHSSCTVKAASSECGPPATAASKDSCTHSDPLPLSFSPNQREADVFADRESCANVLEKMDSLSFMGSQDCQWDWSDASVLRFRLLRGGLRLAVRLGHVTGDGSRVRSDGVTWDVHGAGSRAPSVHGHVRADTPVLAAEVEVAREESDPLSRMCLRLACEAMRYECVRARVDSARSVPQLLGRCAAVAKVARTWARAMAYARMNLAYDVGKDGTLRLNVANIPLRTIYEVSFRIQLAVGDARESAWPRADGVRVRDVTSGYTRHGSHASHAGDVTPDAVDVRRLSSRVPQDWGHVPRTLWKVFRHLKNKTVDDELFGDLALHRHQHRTS